MGRILACGALLWSVYAVFIVLRLGIVLDQDIVPAQVIAGSVHYPPGHPHLIFYPRVFNLPTYLLAGLWALRPDPILLSALRNWIFAFLTAFMPFAMAAVLTRKPAWGHAAALFTFSETARQFRVNYPNQMFPDFNSDGHIGAHAAMLIVVLLIACFWKWGGFLLGLLPAIHPTMAIVVWPWSAAYLFYEGRRMAPWDRKRLLLSIGAGLAVCGALALYIILTVQPAAAPPPYDSHANGPEIYRQFELTTDTHRQPIEVISRGFLMQPVALFLLIAMLAWKNSATKKPVRWLFLLSLLIWSYVGSAWLVSRITHWLPLLVQISMPARFPNLTAMMLIPLGVAVIARTRLAPAVFTGLLLVQAALTPHYHELLRWNFIFPIWGSALASYLYLQWQKSGKHAMAFPSWCAPAAFLLVVIVSLGIPSGEAWAALRSRSPGYRMQDYDHQLNAWLAAHAAPDEPILVPSGPPTELQVKTGHPVMMELETLYLMTYRPDMAPVIGAMARDFYGIDYADPARLKLLEQGGGRIYPGSSPLAAAWQSRSAAEWIIVGQKYKFRLVLSLTAVPLPLPAVLPGPQWTLYSIE